MTLPIYTDLAAARTTILRRVPLDEFAAPPSLLDGIAQRFGARLTPQEAVERIVRDVRAEGDAALRRYSKLLDGAELDQFEVPPARMAQAAASLPADLLAALELAAAEIERFHRRQTKQTWVEFGPEGALGQIITPLRRVGLYAPGGAAPLPSSLLMAAIPARVAGVDEIIVCSPPQRGTTLPAEIVMAAAQIAGVQRLFALGGAQAIAAMAYGTASVPQVDKIAGPGNLFVVLAKRAVYGAVGIEALPGPTETLLIADANADPRYVAADLLAQSEHVLAAAILLTNSPALADAVAAEVERQLAALPEPNRTDAATALRERGGALIVADLETAFDLANDYAPEHLCLLLTDPWAHVGRVRNAGGVFLGERSFEVLGDYVAGPSHIMPTGQTARFSSPVNVDDFRKIISLVGLNEAALRRIGPAAARIADAEGLAAHAAAVRQRLET